MDFLPYFFKTFVLLNVYFSYKVGQIGAKIACSKNVDQLDSRFFETITTSSH